MTGINILPGQIKAPSISGNPLNMNLRIDYTITFTPTNIIQNPGTIVVTFPSLPPTAADPNSRSFILDSQCRVVNGLTPLPGNENVSCVSSGSQLIITQFQTFYSQVISVKVFATNPGRPAVYGPFTIETYTTQGAKKYKIDENSAAGSLAISEVNSLNYVQIDFFKKMVNGTFNDVIPLDFRLYPKPGNELPLTTGGQTGIISIQIPLLWRNKGASYLYYQQQGTGSAVKYGNDPASTIPVSYNLNVYEIQTPKSTDYVKYPQKYGLGQCDLPISINSVIIPPFGGKYLFRVLTFKNGAHYVDQPLEQDIYQMDIEIPPFTSATVQTTGSESGDLENVIIASLVTGLQIPYEGAINFNMTTTTIYAENTSKWDFKLGQTMGVDIESLNVPCSVYISGNLCGFSDSSHPDVRCYVFKGSAIENVILQVRGFSVPISPNTNIKIYIPNIRLCEDVNKVCYIQINSSYTVDIIDPYILNTIYVKVVNSVNTPSPVPKTPVIQPKPTFGNSLAAQQEICVSTQWDLGNSFYTTPFKSGDSIIIIFPSYRYTYRRIEVQSITFNFGPATGSVQYINYYINQETFYLITLNANVPLGSNLILNNVKNANDIIDFGDMNKVQGVILKGYFWQTKLKTSYVQWVRSDPYVDGGILTSLVQILPNEAPGVPVRSQVTDMEWESEVVYKISFVNCRIIPADGKIMIKLPNNSPGYKSISDQCTIYQGLTGISQLTLASSIECKKQIVSSDTYLSITKFQQVPQETLITVIFRATSPVFQGPSWDPGAYYITSHQSDSPTYTMINFTRLPIPSLIVNGPNIFPKLAIWQSFYIEDRLAREGERGYFKMTFESPLAFAKGSTMIVDFGGGVSQPITIETVYDVDNLQMKGYLYCTIDGDICEDCVISGNVVTLLLPKSQKLDGIQANKQYLLQIGYRGNDDSSTTRDGFQINQAGTYILSASITDGSNTVSTQKAYRNLPPSFRNFWVYSVNKMNTDITDTKCFGGGTNICGMTAFIFYFNHLGIPKSYIAGSSSTKIILDFSTQIGDVFLNGFDSTLGTGKPQRSQIPCEGKWISILSGFDKLSCQLYLGTKPNPTQIIITNFDDIVSNLSASFPNDYELHIPNVFNPAAIKEVIQVTMRVETTYFLTGQTRPIYENSYILVNMTNSIQSFAFHQNPVYVDLSASCDPTFSQTLIDTPSRLYVCLQTGPHQLQPGDKIIYQFPDTWVLPRIDFCSLYTTFLGVSNKCDSYDSSKQILIHVTGSVAPNTMITGHINMNTPPYAALIPTTQQIYGFTYWRSRIISQFKLKNFSQSLTPLTIPSPQIQVQASSTVQGEIAEYTIRYDVLRDIPNGGCIQIIVPSEFDSLNKENICRNAILQSSDFDPYGYQFKCDYVVDTPNYLLIHSFGPFKLDFIDPINGFQKRNGTTLVVNFRLQNPLVANPSQWQIKQWYLKQVPLNYLVATGNTNSPPLTPPVIVEKWEKLLQTRNKIYTDGLGPLEFIITIPSALSAGSFITVQLPTTFLKQSDSQLYCYFDLSVYYNNQLPSKTCKVNASNLVTIETPDQKYLDPYLASAGSPIPANTKFMIGISTIDNYYGNNGFKMPSVSGFYDFKITFPGTPQSTAIRTIYVPHKNFFTIFEPTTLVNNPNEKTVIELIVQPKVYSDSLILYVPVADQEGNNLFDEDLGLEKVKGLGVTSINCQYHMYPSGPSTSLSCQLTRGNQATNTHAQIKIQGITFNIGSTYVISIDEVTNPDIKLDDRHIYMILEGYSGSTLVSSQINYDFSFKYISTPEVIAFNPNPNAVPSGQKYPKIIMGGTGAGPNESNINYEVTWDTKDVMKTGNQYYDYFIIEFPLYAFNRQPVSVSCSIGFCKMLRGWNWVIWKYNADTPLGATVKMKVQGLENAKISSTTIHLIGYTVKNRVLINKQYFTPLDPVNPINPSPGDFTIDVPDYPNKNKVPKNKMMRYLFKIKLPVLLEKDKGLLDIRLPSGYVPEPYCQDHLQYPFTYSNDYISCKYTAGINAFTISGYDNIPVGTTVQIEGWITNPNAQQPSPTFYVDIYQDTSRSLILSQFSAVGPKILDYTPFTTAKYLPEYNTYVRKNTYGEFRFIVSGVSLTENDYLTIKFPNNDISNSGATYLQCGFNNYEASLCKVVSTSPLTIQIYGPVENSISSSTTYTVFITVQNGSQLGLQYTQSGLTYFQVSQSSSPSDFTNVFFTIYPSESFSNLAQLEITFENAGKVMDLIVNFSTTVNVPANGRIVVSFPMYSEDRSTPLFDMYLGKSGLSPGSQVDCTYLQSSVSYTGCTIDSDFYKVSVSFKLNIALNGQAILLINDILMPTSSGAAGNIPIELYTQDSTGVILEAVVFDEHITPIQQTPDPTLLTSSLNVVSADTYQIQNVNVGSAANSFSSFNDRIIIKFPIGYDLSGIDFKVASVYNPSEIIAIGNIVIARLESTINSGNILSMTLSKVKNPKVQPTNLKIYTYVAISSIYNNYYQSTIPSISSAIFTSAVLSLPTHSSNGHPIAIKITATPPSTIYGAQTVYFVSLKSSLAVTVPRNGLSLPCDSGSEPIYCELRQTSTYGYIDSNPVIYIYQTPDATSSAPLSVTIYNIQEYQTKSSIQVDFGAIDIATEKVTFKNSLTSVSIAATTKTVTSAIITQPDIGPIQQSTIFTFTQNNPLFVSGTKILFMSDNLPITSLTYTPTAQIVGSSTSTCSVNPNDYVVTCTIGTGVSLPFDLELKDYPLPTTTIPSTSNAYYLIGYESTTTKNVFQYNSIQFSQFTTTPALSSSSAVQKSDHSIQVDFTTSYVVPALGQVEILLASTPVKTGFYYTIPAASLSKFGSTPTVSLVGSKVIIKNFYLMAVGSYQINLYFEEQPIPQIQSITTLCNKLEIEKKAITQTVSAYPALGQTIVINTLQKADSEGIIFDFTTTKTITSPGYIAIKFDVNIASSTFNAQLINYSKLKLLPKFTRLADTLYITNFDTFTAGKIQLRLFFSSPSPSSVLSIISTDRTYDVVDQKTVATTIIQNPFFKASTVSPLRGINFIDNHSIGGAYQTIRFRLKLQQSFNPITEQLFVTFPTQMQTTLSLFYTNQIRFKCNIKKAFQTNQRYRARKCHLQKYADVYLIIQDYAFTTSDVFDISIIKIGDSKYQWQLPSTAMIYYFQIDKTDRKFVQDTTSPTIYSTDSLQMEIFSQVAKNQNFRNFDGTISASTLYNIQFTLGSGGYDFIDIEFPLNLDQGSSSLTYFNQNLGVLINNGFSFPCEDKAVNLGSSVKYRLFYGQIALQNPSKIRIISTSSNTVNINIATLLNPSTLNSMIPLRIKSGFIDGRLNNVLSLPYAVFTLANNPVISTLPTPSFSPNQASTIATISINGLALLKQMDVDSQSSLKFEIEPHQYYSLTNVGSTSTNFQTQQSAFFSFTATKATPYNMAIAQIKTPPIIGSFSYTYKVTEIRNRKVRQVFSLSSSVILVPGNKFIDNASITASNLKKLKTNAAYKIKYDLKEDQFIGNVITVKLPSQYTVVSTGVCQLQLFSNLATIQNTCVTDVPSNTYIIQLQQNLSSGQTFVISFNINNPTTVGLTGNFIVELFTDNTKSTKQHTETIVGVTIINELELIIKLLQPFSIVRFCQKDDTCPIRFTVKLTSNLVKQTDCLVIKATNYLNKMISLQSPIKELSCWIDDYASFYCYQDFTTNEIYIFAPSNTDIPSGTIFNIYIESWRDPKYQSYPLTQNFLLLPSYLDYLDNSAIFKNVEIFEKHGASLTSIKKNWQFVNKAFNWNNPAFICSYTATKDKETILKVRFQMTPFIGLNSALTTQPNWGRYVIYLETKNEIGEDLIPFNLESRFTKDGQQIDCICDSCGYTFLCYVQYGGNDVTSPVSITIQPQQYIWPGTLFQFYFPKIKLPPLENRYVRMSLKAIQYDSANKRSITLLELLGQYIIYTTLPTPTVNPIATLSYPSGHRVGDPLTINWQYNIPQQQLQNTRDRVVITTTTSDMIIEHPHNPGGTLYTTSSQGRVWIYPLVKWLEIEFNTNLGAGSKTVTTINFKNMPYQITNGVDYELYNFADGETRNIQKYSTIPYAAPHPLYAKAFSFTVQYIQQPNTLTFTYKPYNKIPVGGYISIYWGKINPSDPTETDWVFINNYCKVISGLQDASCNIIPQDMRIQIYDFTLEYDPTRDGMIKFDLQVQNSATPGNRQNFYLTTYWDVSGFNNRAQLPATLAKDRHIIDEDQSYSNLNILTTILLKLNLLERYQEPIEVCGGRRGPIQLKFQFRRDYKYPFDYIRINFYSEIQPLAAGEELICYFADTTNAKLVYIKTFRCDLNALGVIDAYVPEETDLKSDREYLLYMTVRTSLVNNWGIQIKAPSALKWTRIQTMKEPAVQYDEVAWIEAKIPPCPFDPNNFRVYAMTHEYNTLDYSTEIIANANAEKYQYNFINVTLAAFNPIDQGGKTYNKRTRIIFEFMTHNEIFPSWDEDVTGNKYTTAQPAACGGMYNGNSYFQPASGNSIECTILPASGQSISTPSIIIMENYQSIAVNTIFNVGLGRIRNPNQLVDGTIFTQIGYKKYDKLKTYQTSAHLRITIEQKQSDGTFYAINRQWRYYLIPEFLEPIPPAPFDSSKFMVSHTTNYVNQGIGNNTINIYPLDMVLSRLRSAVVVQYSYPYEMTYTQRCYQHNYLPWAIPHGRVACTQLSQSRWVVFSNNIFTYTTPQPPIPPNTTPIPIINRFYAVDIQGSRVNPPFTYDYTNPKSLQRGWVYNDKRTVIMRTSYNISPIQTECGVVLETTAHDNPQNREVIYRLGLYIYTRANEMQTIRLIAPPEFQEIRRCRVKMGVVLKDFNNIQNAIKCTILRQASNWKIEITNFSFREQYSTGLIIIELLILNPYDSGWTKHWICRTFSSNELEIHDLNYSANGRTWVGGYIPFPNLFRVYRNTISHEDRRAGINDYAELNMRLIPRTSHPQTDDTQSTQIQIWMPLTYDIPNGGTNICNVDHIYQTDVDGQYCQITSDRKIFVNTNRFQGLNGQCGLVSFTTINAINNNDGVKMPAVAGDDSFQVFITSKDKNGKVTQEYSNQDATTKPALLTTAGDQFKITTQEHENGQEARVIVEFISPRNIPPGYDTSVGISDPNLKNPIGYIDIQFNTRDYLVGYNGWQLNLISTIPVTPFACKTYGGVIPKQNEKLKCQIIPSTAYSIFYPVTVRVSNFQSISTGTKVEIHLLNIPGPNYNNAGFINVGAFQVNGDGTKFDIIGSSQFALGYSGIYFFDSWRTTKIDVIPNVVGAYSEWIFTFDQLYDTTNTYRGCFDGFYNPMLIFTPGIYFVLKMPKEFEIKDNGSISATLGNLPMDIWVYEETNQIFFLNKNTVPCGYWAGSPTFDYRFNVLRITQMRNAAYKFTAPYYLTLKTYSTSRQFIRDYKFGPILNPDVGSFVLLGMTVSKYFADERYVTYSYTFTPSYNIPAGSQITVTLPNRPDLSYPNFGNASPKEICQVSDSTLLNQASCQSSLSSTGFQINVVQQITENTNIQVYIIGTRNHPSYAKITDPTDFKITITNSLSYAINEGYFPQITFLNKRDPSFLYLSLSGTSYFQNVISDYTFTIQSTTELPQGGFIIMKFPINYLEKALTTLPLPKPNSITGSWSPNSLIYTSNWSGPSSGYYILTITPQFTWPAKTSLTIYYKSFSNPTTTLVTSLFSAYTIYDSKNVDTTDSTDTSLKFTYKPQPDLMGSTFEFSPQNEGSLSTYNMKITPSKDIQAGSTIQFKFDTTLYPSNLSSAKSTVSCFVNGVEMQCTVQNGVVSIPIDSSIPANVPIDIKLNNIMNPIQGTTNIVGQIIHGDEVLQYKSDIGPVNTKKTPNNLNLVKIETSSNALQARARYTFCVQTSDLISANDAVYIYFPSQFPFKSIYACSITPEHSNNELYYDQSISSPTCLTQNDQKRLVITGQISGKTSNNLAKLCYYIDGVENPSVPGTTDNFIIQIFDQTNQVIKSETSGLTSTQTTLSFLRKGFQIIVGSIPDLPKGVVSNEISIELEIAVSYLVTAIPYLANFEFIPPVIVFDPTKGKKQYFKIKPLDQAIVGQKLILWTKKEASSANKFSDIPDSNFNLIAKPYANSLKAILQTTVSRTALLATSLPIEIRLNQPASKVLTISVYSFDHQQDSELVFDPPQIIFNPGEISSKFRYTTKEKAVSGYLQFELDSYYKNIYVMPYTTLSFEILEVDNRPPNVINYYIESMDRTYMYIRISCDESITVYSMLTLLGTEMPTSIELKNTHLREANQRQSDVLELFTRNTSYIAPVSKNYIYYDSYLHFEGLEEQTEYQLYFFVEDLSNNVSPVQSFYFKTLKKHNPCSFTLRVTDVVPDDTLLNAFGLITSIPPERFIITQKPSKYTIPGVIEQEVLDLIESVPIDYSFILLQNKTSDEPRPFEKVYLLDNQFSLLQSELSTGRQKQILDPTFKIIEHSYELIVIPQEFKYTPVLLNKTEESATFIVSLKFKGIGYGIVQLANIQPPTSNQIKNGLNSTNYYLQKQFYQVYKFEFNDNIPEEQQNITNIFTFTDLMDSSEYIAYFVGENNQLVNPDLMETSQIVSVRFQTDREEIQIPHWFRGDMMNGKLIRPTYILLIVIINIVSMII